jgi:hypothetical protein
VSQLQVNQINDASGGVLAPISSVHRNRIINGSCTIDQRNAGAAVSGNGYPVDRWNVPVSQSSKLTAQQNAGAVTPPAGFTNYAGVTSSSAYSVISSDFFLLGQRIEGFNIADLGWGTANAKTVTLSFWVRSSLTGTFGGSLQNSAQTRTYPYSYTISAANTWEYKTVTIAGDTTGTWLTTNGVGVTLWFSLGVGSSNTGTAGAWAGSSALAPTGSTSVVGTNGATFYITGVQLEVGTQATSFEYRQYTTELQLCQRYLPVIEIPVANYAYAGLNLSTTDTRATIPLPVSTRVAPTGISVIGTIQVSQANGTPVGAVTFARATTLSATLGASSASGLVAGNATMIVSNAGGKIQFNGCEL